ncbi:DNA cytosine methyltransferase [Mycoplasma leonicaptivi]|nr:DNA cytosine methyltransferase [Mycoplasma leonicaptivi]
MFFIPRFSRYFNLPDIANCHLYKQAGNSVSVSVIKRIVDRLIESIE